MTDWLISLKPTCKVNIYEAETRIGKKTRALRQKLATRPANEITLKWLYQEFGMKYFVLRELDSNGVERRQILLKPDLEFMKGVVMPAPAPGPELPPAKAEISAELANILE